MARLPPQDSSASDTLREAVSAGRLKVDRIPPIGAYVHFNLRLLEALEAKGDLSENVRRVYAERDQLMGVLEEVGAMPTVESK